MIEEPGYLYSADGVQHHHERAAYTFRTCNQTRGSNVTFDSSPPKPPASTARHALSHAP